MEIPPILSEYVRQGKVVLILGAGASMGASDSKGCSAPSGQLLGTMLAQKFLGGNHKDLPLSQISELAISETDLISVQGYIREIFEVLKPTNAHKQMCSFVWHGIATTNFDLLIEDAYRNTLDAAQTPIPFVANGDRFEEKLRDRKNVPLLKLHGCITRTNDSDCPLILTTDQYVEYRKGRTRIFDHLTTWAYELPVVFIGQSLQDYDLRTILQELTNLGEKRPRYYLVAPNVDSMQRRYWETKKITPLQGSFGEFLGSLDATIPKHFRGLAVGTKQLPHSILQKAKVSDATLSSSCKLFLENDAEYVKAVTSTEQANPKYFYKGTNPGWAAIEQNLDVRRHLVDTILSDHFLITESAHRQSTELILIKAHAGSGKSVLMRRLAWDATHDYDRLCLYLRPNGMISAPALQELVGICKERIFLFVDNAADRAREIQSLVKAMGDEGKKLTVIMAERTNEWNISGASISPFIHTVQELRYLSLKEIDSLLSLLERHKALGTLEHENLEQRRKAFSERAGRQLLVALHEATLGEPFEAIIEDEYRKIVPLEAQQIYLTICTLNRLDIRVRAGIVSRIHNIPFTEFKTSFFAPLEHVVQTDYDPVVRDFTYRARHPYIAQIVFERVLHSQEDRYEVYIRCLRELNIDYASDRSAFRQMVKSRTLIELFPNHDLAKGVLGVAMTIGDEDGFVLHQVALYEMNRVDGNLQEASELLNKALQVTRYEHSFAVKHSMAELKLRLAEVARTPLEREKCLSEASVLAQGLKSSRSDETYAHHTLVKIGLQRLQDVLKASEQPSLVTIETLVKDIERNLQEGLQLSPSQSYLLEAEAQLANLFDDATRALEALEKAFQVNPRSTFIALRLSSNHKKHGQFVRAKEILEKALEANPGETRLHYAFSKLLVLEQGTTSDVLIYHLKRSFTEGDSNYDAQLLYGRQLFIDGEIENSKQVFRRLGDAKVSHEVRVRLLYPLDQVFTGSITNLEATYCFIVRDGWNDWIYAHMTNIGDTIWTLLTLGSRMTFRIAFTMKGPSAVDINLAP
ncbi:MAG: SIR2 family protein [Nitrospirota bacterium]